MEVIKYILLAIDGIISVMLIALMLMQSEKSEGAGTVISGGNASEGYLNNSKDRSKEGTLRRITIVAGIAFMVVTFTLSLIYVIPVEENVDLTDGGTSDSSIVSEQQVQTSDNGEATSEVSENVEQTPVE